MLYLTKTNNKEKITCSGLLSGTNNQTAMGTRNSTPQPSKETTAVAKCIKGPVC